MGAVMPYIPETITVHLGAPDSNAQNVTVSFPDYVKTVASGEIYPTWPESAIRANIYAIISFALNKVFLEFYRSRGYNFDITGSTAYDQIYTPGRNIFDNISRIVDEIFNSFIRCDGVLEPLAAEFCNGTTVTCEGLSQWGTVSLAEQGLVPYEILQYYYGDDINIVTNVPIRGLRRSYPGTPVRRGDSGSDVSVIQTELNRISQNYPAIPKVYPVDGIFGEDTENAVRRFQEIFDLTPDGVVGQATWYKLVYLYVGIKRLAELESEGQQLFGLSFQYPDAVSEGDRGEKVIITQYMLSVLSDFYSTIPPVAVDGVFGGSTANAVVQAQKTFGLPPTGVVDRTTWNTIYDAFLGILQTVSAAQGFDLTKTATYPGYILSRGDRGQPVRDVQEYLNFIALNNPEIPITGNTGEFGPRTVEAVKAFQRLYNIPVTGQVDRTTWNTITGVYSDQMAAQTSRGRQFPGFTMREGDTDSNTSTTNI